MRVGMTREQLTDEEEHALEEYIHLDNVPSCFGVLYHLGITCKAVRTRQECSLSNCEVF